MPTPVGHVLGGVAVYLAAKDRPLHEDLGLAATCLGVSLLPDLDFAIKPFAGRSYHHYFTHSLGFAVIFAVAVYLLARLLKRSRPLFETSVLTGVYLSHIVLDLLAKDTSPPFGVELFWPFSGAFYISNVIIFDDVWRGSLGKLFGLHNWMTVAREVLILAPVAALAGWLARRRPASTSST
jgi:inner membrane protein